MTLGCMVHNIVEPFIKYCIDIIFLSKNMKPVTFAWPYIHRLIRLSESIFHILTVLTYSDCIARFGKETFGTPYSRREFPLFQTSLHKFTKDCTETRHGLVNLILPRTLTQMAANQEQKVSHTSQ